MAIRLIALDLDDTLLREDLSISAANKNAVSRAVEAGIQVVLASGRNIHSMRYYARELLIDGPGNYMICSNGAEIVRTDTESVLEERRLEPGLCAKIVDEIELRGFPWQVYEQGLILVNRPSPWAAKDSRLSGQPAILMEDREPLMSRGAVKFVVPGEPDAVEKLRAELEELFGAQAEILISKPYFLEIMPLGVSKGEALLRLAARLGIQVSETMAVGDAMNDLDMIRMAGSGCAPANAVAAVKAAARFVSRQTNEEDAVAELIGRVALSAPEHVG